MKYLICTIIALLPASIRAQDATPPVIPEPLIAPHAPAYSNWTVTYTYSGKLAPNSPTTNAAQQGALIQQRVTKKTGDVRMELSIFPAARGERWQMDSSIAVRDANSNTITIDPPSPIATQSDFGEFSWITKANFKGIRTVDGKKVLVFEDKIDGSTLSNPRYHPTEAAPDLMVTATALIDFDSRLPTSLKGGDQSLKYEFLPAPTEKLVLPPAFVTVIQQYEKQLKLQRAPFSPP